MEKALINPDPRLSQYLASNDPLPEKLRPPLNDFLTQLESRISSLEEQKATLDQQISVRRAQIEVIEKEISTFYRDRNRLEAERFQVKKKRKQYGAIVSPVRQIPPEVVASILAFALTTRDGLLGRSERLQFMQYRHVSRLWRTTSLSSPSLWRGIRVSRDHFEGPYPLHGEEPETPRCFLRRLSSWFSHAGKDGPVQLAASPIRGLRVAHILDLIRQPTFNISSLVLENNSASHFRNYRDLDVLFDGSRSYPTITSLTLSLPNRLQAPGEGPESFDLTSSFPNLCTFTLTAAGVKHFLANVAHSSLRHLRLNLGWCSPIHFCRMMQNLPGLETLRLYRCFAEVEANGVEVELPPYIHGKLDTITFVHSVPFQWIKTLTCPSVKLVRVEGDYGSKQKNANVGKRLGELIDTSMASDLSFIASASRQAPLVRELLKSCPSIKSLGICHFSDLDPPNFADNRHNDDGIITSHPFIIPASLEFVQCSEKTTKESFWSWTDTLERYLRPGQELKVEAPGCITLNSPCTLGHYIPPIEAPSWTYLVYSYAYRENALVRGGKFAFYVYGRKAVVVCRRRRLECARRALRVHRTQRFMKAKLREERRPLLRRSAIFSEPLVS